MVYKAHTERGQIIVDEPMELPDGTLMLVKVAAEEEYLAGKKPSCDYELLKEFIGKANDLPEDFALNHAHYVHGRPKR